jgi:hypothetical protein
MSKRVEEMLKRRISFHIEVAPEKGLNDSD